MASSAEEVRQGLGVDVELLQRLFTAMEDTISKVDEQEVVLIVGYAGTGKSTNINYFLENPLEIREIEETGDIEVHPRNPHAANTPPVGSKMRGSQTFYPETYGRQGAYPVVFCDTGGLNHTGDLEEKIAIYYAIRSILLRARSVKAVVIMYKEAQIEADRACFQLAQLVKEIRSYLGPKQSEYQNSLFLFFNECTKTVEQLKRRIRISRDNLAQSERLTEQEAADDLSFLLEREGNIRIINPRDRGETREILLPLLHGARGIGESYRAHVTRAFQGPYYGHLMNVSESIAGIFLRLHQMLNMQREAAETLRQDIQTLRQNIQNDEQIADPNNVNFDVVDATNRQIGVLERDIERYEARILQLEQVNIDLQRDIDQLRGDHGEIFAGETEVYDERQRHGEQKVGTIIENSYSFDARPGLPICRPEEIGTRAVDKGTHGYFTQTEWSSDRYKSKYVGPSHYYGHAQVRFYAHRCDTRASKSQIEIKQEAITNNTATIADLRIQRERALRELQDLRNILRNAEDTRQALAAAAQERLRTNRLLLREKQTQLNQIEAQIRQTELDLRNNQAKFMTLRRLCDVITHLREEPTIREFLQLSENFPFVQPAEAPRGAANPHGHFAHRAERDQGEPQVAEQARVGQ